MDQDLSLSSHRRANDRFMLDNASTVSLVQKPQLRVRAKDVSVRGIGIALNEPLVPQDRMDIVVNAAILRYPIQRKGRVAWCEKTATGLFRAGLDFGIDNQIDL